MFSGSHVALITPLRNGKVDVERLEDLVEFHIEAGTNGIVPCGTTGESATFDHAEHELVIEAVVNKVAGRVPVIAGTGSNATSEAIRLTRFAREVGADAALVITPYYNKPTQDGLYRHYAEIAASADLPLILYNVPSRTSIDLLPATIARLAEMPTIVGIKEASGSIDRSVEILRACDIEVLSGDDALTLPLMAVGAVGVISVAANVAPQAMVDLVDLARDGDFQAACKLHYRLYPLFKAMFVETNPIPVKAAAAMMGLCGPEIRLPLTELSAENREVVAHALSELELYSPS